MSGFGLLSWNWHTAILAFSTRDGPPLDVTTFCSSTRPSTSSVSSIVPPTFFTMRISRRSTDSPSPFFGSTIRSTLSTAIGAKTDEYCETTLELRDVVAARNRLSRSFKFTGVEISFRYSTALVAACWNDSAMTVGCMPFVKSFSAAPRRLPAMTTTDVVPSPASTSCA